MEIISLKYLAILIGIYLAWNIGANDVANAISTSVGSKALTLKKAVIIAAIFEFIGAYFLGENVSKTIQSGIVNPNVFQNIHVFIIGMTAALFATGIWLNLASFLKLPVSTTHAIVGAVVGFGAIIGGIHALHWSKVLLIFLSWIVTPILSGLLAYLIFSFLQKKILFALSPIEASQKYIPFLCLLALSIFSFSITYGQLTHFTIKFSFEFALLISLVFGLIGFIISFFLVKKIKITVCKITHHHPNQLSYLKKAKKNLEKIILESRGETKEKTEKLLDEIKILIQENKERTRFHEKTTDYFKLEKAFGYLQIISVCLIACAHGTNDVANAIGPVAAVIQSLKYNQVQFASIIPPWILLLGSIGIIIGLSTWGWRVVETIGKNITTLSPTRGFSAELSAATIILFASKMGLPISTTHALVGAVLGVGLAKGLSALNLKTLKDIFLSWIITLPVCAVLSIIVFYIFKFVFPVFKKF